MTTEADQTISEHTDDQQTVTIAAGCSFDMRCAFSQHAMNADLDYVVVDFLTEGTMARLALARMQDAERGFAEHMLSADALDFLPRMLENGTKLVTNAGGLAPVRCAELLQEALRQRGSDPVIAVVDGDEFAFPDGDATVVCRNAYLGAGPIAAALDMGAQIVITGRVVDSALTVGPLLHEFGWDLDNYEVLGKATLIGHLLECGAQPTGGVHSDWWGVDWSCSSFPIAECAADGSAVLGHSGGGGLISVGSIAEQILYEIDDPSRYLMPDVTCDLSGVFLSELPDGRIALAGATGRAPSGALKVNSFIQDGWRARFGAVVSGPDSAEIADRSAAVLHTRVAALLAEQGWCDDLEFHCELLTGQPVINGVPALRLETMLRLVVDHREREALEHLLLTATASSVAMGPGTSAPLISQLEPLLVMRSELVDRNMIIPMVRRLGEAPVPVPFVPLTAGSEPSIGAEAVTQVSASAIVAAAAASVVSDANLLSDLAYLRSGDKGAIANIGVIARAGVPLATLDALVSEERVRAWFRQTAPEMEISRVRRFLLPGLSAVNLVLDGALGGGAVSSPRTDTMGKGLAPVLGAMPVDFSG